MIHVLLADDHQMLIDGLSAILEHSDNITIAGQATNGLEVLEFIGTHKVDVILMDYNMPKMDGLECTREVVAHHPEVKVLILSMHQSQQHIQRILKAGAHGYILKNTGKAELENAIRQVMDGKSFFSQEVTEQIMLGLQNKQKTQDNYQISDLTEREKEVLVLITEELTTHEIADKLCISKHTVESHRKNLISKLNVRNVTGLVKYAVQQGLVD